MSWEGRKRTTDGKREGVAAKRDDEEGRKERKREERKELGKYDKVTSCSAAARLQHIWNTSSSWKILQEIREKGGGVVKEWGPLVTHFSAIPLHHCV